MKIHSIGDYYAEVDDSPPPLKQLLKDESGKSFRRIDRFIQLALIGVSRCVKSKQLSAQTSVYLTSGQGDLDITIDVLEQIYKNGEPPKPLSFINTVSNAACFNIASHLSLQGKSSFVTGHYFSFERCLELAYLDYLTGKAQSTLVGSVDICTVPLAQHRERIGVDEQCALGEGSHWWLLGEARESCEPIAELLAVEHFNDEDSMCEWLNKLQVDDSYYIARGQYLEKSQFKRLKLKSNIKNDFEYCEDTAFYNTKSGSVLNHFIEAKIQGTLIHINADPEGRFCTFLIRTNV